MLRGRLDRPSGVAMTGGVHLKLADQGALLFDLDGTLVDTMPLHRRAYQRVFADRGLHLTAADYDAAVGAPARAAIPRFLRAAGAVGWTEADVRAIHEAKKECFDAGFDAAALPQLPAADLLARAAGQLPIALVTSANARGLKTILDGLGWWDRFDVIVSGDDVVRGKPHPEPYATAAAALGVVPARGLAFEDTADGLASARAAGLHAIDVTRPWSVA